MNERKHHDENYNKKNINIRMDREVSDKLKYTCKEAGIDRIKVINELCKRFLNNVKSSKDLKKWWAELD